MVLKAIQREDEHHFDKQREFADKREQGGFDVLFFGDSLTRRWEDNPELWNRYFGRFHPLNFGVGADTLENMMWRVAAGNLDGLSPRLIHFLAGTNNLSEDPWPTVLEKILALIETMEGRLPGVPFIVTGLYPRNPDDKGIDYNGMIRNINPGLESFCAGRGYRFLDFSALLLDGGGRVRESVQPDGLHLNDEGYRLIGPVLEREIEAMLR